MQMLGMLLWTWEIGPTPRSLRKEIHIMSQQFKPLSHGSSRSFVNGTQEHSSKQLKPKNLIF